MAISSLNACDANFKAKVENAYRDFKVVNQILQKYCGTQNKVSESSKKTIVTDNYTIKENGKVFSPYGHDITPTPVTSFEEDMKNDIQNGLGILKKNSKSVAKQDVVEYIRSQLFNYYSGNTASRLQNKKAILKNIKNQEYDFKTISQRHNFSFNSNDQKISTFDIVELESMLYRLDKKSETDKITYLKNYKQTHETLENMSRQFYSHLQSLAKNTIELNKIAPELSGNIFRFEYNREQTIGLAKIINYIQTKKLGIKTNNNIQSNATIEQLVNDNLADCDLLTSKFYLDTFEMLGIDNAFSLILDNEGDVDHILPCLDFGNDSYCIESTKNKVDEKFIIPNNKFARELTAKDYAPGIGRLPFNVKLNKNDLAALYLNVYETIPSELNLMLTKAMAANASNNKMLLEYKGLIDFHKFIINDVREIQERFGKDDIFNSINKNELNSSENKQKTVNEHANEFAEMVARNSYRLLVEAIDMFNKAECDALSTKHFGAYLPIYRVDRNFFISDLNNNIIEFMKAYPQDQDKIRKDFAIYGCDIVNKK